MRRLPPRPSLEQQKKRAKELLSAFLAGDADARARIAAVLPDRRAVTLADAQLTLAREYGFPSWPKLVRHVEGLRGEPRRSAASALRSVIQLRDARALRVFLRNRPEARAHIDDPIFQFGAPPIVQVAAWGDVALVDALLEAGADPNRRSDWWAGPFHALHHARGKVAERLIAGGAAIDMCAAANLDRADLVRTLPDVHERGGDGKAPLHFARSREVVDILLARGADIDARDIDHRSTPAEWMLEDRPELAAYLVERGARADIFMAAALGLTDRLRELLEEDAALVARRTGAGEYGEEPPASFHYYTWSIGQGVSPFGAALKFGQRDAAELLVLYVVRDAAVLADELSAAAGRNATNAVSALLDARADAVSLRNSAGGTALHAAAMAGAAACCSLLLERGADPDARDRSDRAAPLHYAAEAGHIDVVRTLAESGADIDGDGDEHLLGVLGWATCFDRVHADVADYLLARGARLGIFPAIALGRVADVRALIARDPSLLDAHMNGADMELRTPLHHAVERGSPAIIEALLAAGADPNARDRFGQRPAAYVRDGAARARILDLLIRHGAEPDDLLTLLLLRRFGDAQALVARDAAALSAPPDRPTPLHHAVARGDRDAASWLIEQGADIDAIRTMGGCGVTPLHVAAARDLPDMAALLLEADADPTIRDTRWGSDALGWADYMKSRTVHGVIADALLEASSLRPHERATTALVTAYGTGDETALRIVWEYFGHRRSLDAMRRYVRLELGRAEHDDRPLLLEEARLLVARAQGFTDWDELAAAALVSPPPAGPMTDARLSHVAPDVEELDLSSSHVTDDGLRSIAHLPRLRRLNLAGTRVTDVGVAHLAACNGLERLDLSGTPTGDGAIRALAGGQWLRDFRSGERVTDDGIAALHDLPMFREWRGGDVRMSLLGFDAEPNYLMLRGTFGDRGMARLVGLDGLFALNVDDARLDLTAAAVSPLAELPHLQWLAFDAKDDSMPRIAALPHLRFLMCQDTTASDEGFAALGRSQTIEYIWGRRCHGLRRRGFLALSEMPALAHLSVSCLNVDDEGLAALQRFPALVELMPMDVPDDGYRHIARCERLESLVLMYCRETTDAATAHIVALPRLQQYFASYTRITDRTPALLSTMDTLEQITFDACAGLTDAGVTALARLPRLRVLSLSGMQNVTRDVVRAFPDTVRVDWSA